MVIETRDAWHNTPPPDEIAAASPPEVATEDIPLCPVCAHDGFQTHAIGFDYELLTCRNPWRFVHCDVCGHVWLNPRPVIDALSIIYPPHYYAYNYETQINPLAVRGKNALDALKMRGIVDKLPRAPASFLDVGCGTGRFMKAMEKRGVPRNRDYGLELDEKVVDDLKRQGYQAFCERVESTQSIPEGEIDLVTMFHVIEHVDDPGAVARAIARWLSPDGIFALETPNIESWDARFFQDTFWGGYHIPRHWNLFSRTSLSRLLAASGLEVVATRYQTGHSFWMYSLHHQLRYGPRPRPRLARWFNPLRGLPFLVGFTVWDKLRAALGFKTSSMLLLARKARKT